MKERKNLAAGITVIQKGLYGAIQLKVIAGNKAQANTLKEPKSLVKLRAILNDAGMRK